MTEYISKIQDENTGKIAYFKDAEARNQLKNTVKKTVIENGKLYLLKDDGTKIDTGTTLPVVENGSSVSIDDSTTSIDKTWSSDKINSQLNNIANQLGRNEDGTEIELETTEKSVRGAINELKNNQCSSVGGLSSTVITLLMMILNNAVYESDQTSNIKALEEALKQNSSGGSAGGETGQNDNIIFANSILTILKLANEPIFTENILTIF